MCQSDILLFYVSWTWQTHWHIESLCWNDKRPQTWIFMPNLNGWPYCEYEVFREFLAKLKNEHYHSLVDIGSCSPHCARSFPNRVLRNLSGSWRNFCKVHTWFSTTPLPQHGMNCLGYHCHICKNVLFIVCFLVNRFDLPFLTISTICTIYYLQLLIINYLLLTDSFLSFHFSSQFK